MSVCVSVFECVYVSVCLSVFVFCTCVCVCVFVCVCVYVVIYPTSSEAVIRVLHGYATEFILVGGLFPLKMYEVFYYMYVYHT